MEFEVAVENEQQFWNDIQEIVSAPCSSEDVIDNALRSYLSLATKYKDHFLSSELEVTRCSYKLLASTIFVAHTDYVRRQMIYGLLQEDDLVTLHLIASFLLFDGRQHEVLLHMMNDEGVFPRLLDLLQTQTKQREHASAGLHRLLMDLLYEMSRIQRIKIEDLVLVDDDFIQGLFDIIEDFSYDVNDPYHYPVIRVLLVLNEQFMISAHNPVGEGSPSNSLTNKVIKILSMHGNLYKTFGENIILLINREAETSLQLLTLKLLYLIFTTSSTYEYFYTNDLHVLVDILIRNLLDLPEEASALRHTYLRVLYPLLAHTQLKNPPHYKKYELKRMLNLLVRGQLSENGTADREKIMHFDDVDETTKRLVLRCAAVDWLQEEQAKQPLTISRPPPREDSLIPPSSATEVTAAAFTSDANIGTCLESSQTLSSASTRESSPDALSSTTLDGLDSSASTLDSYRKPSQAQPLGFHLGEEASSSTLSVHEVASQHEKPGIITPSRNNDTNSAATTITPAEPHSNPNKRKIKPLPPKARRWRGRRATGDEESSPITAEIITDNSTPEQISPLPPSTPKLVPESDRRNSTTTSGLAPPVPAHHIRRSASNPPPAVPPPRRSITHHNQHHHHHPHISSYCTPVTSPRLQPQCNHSQKPPQKPEPPKTRRWGRAKHAKTDSSDRGSAHGSTNSTSSLPSECSTPTEITSNMHITPEKPETVSVEEALHNVSL